jgi:murein DD-endopeptidase MepM/ murein hydrolase activator NlpD
MKRLALALAAVLLVAAGDPKTETEHIVAEGETLRSIAARAGVPVAVIAQTNGMMESARVRKGETLIIPRQHSHTVKRGESPFAIAYQYGVSWEQIATANGFDASAAPRPGQKLIIPALLSQLARIRPVERAAPAQPAFVRPSPGEIVLGWQRRSHGGHDGIDFAAAAGDRVSAAAAGTVIFAGDEPIRFGKLVVLDHGGGWHTAYGYLSRVTVKKGDTVRTGERIGLTGRSGEAGRPQVHFEIRRGDKPVDPAPLLAPGP